MLKCFIMKHFVTATTQRRRAEWERVFGTDQLPVTRSAPSLSPAGCLTWTLDANRLHWMQVNRLVYWLARRDKLTAAHARALVMAGLPIPAHDVALVYDEQEQRAPAFLLHLVNLLCGKILLATHNV